MMRFLPAVLKELSRHVPTILFQTVDWGELALEIPKISKRLIQKEGFHDLFELQKNLLDPYHIVLTDTLPDKNLDLNKKVIGEQLLTLYFVQLFSDSGIFLDLRFSHFAQNNLNLIWHPSSLWCQLEHHFRIGLLKVYEGFYFQNDHLYYQGLEDIGLLKSNFSKEEKDELGNLFRMQFGSALDQEMNFELKNLTDSIIKMSHFLLSKKIRISKDFLYLGIYLVTLYSSLEELGVQLPVKKIFLDVHGRFSNDI